MRNATPWRWPLRLLEHDQKQVGAVREGGVDAACALFRHGASSQSWTPAAIVRSVIAPKCYASTRISAGGCLVSLRIPNALLVAADASALTG